MTGIKGGGGGVERFTIQNINTEETVFGRSYLLGNRKGLAGLKNKRREINQIHIFESKEQPIETRFAETFEREWTCFLHDVLSFLCPAAGTAAHLGYWTTENIKTDVAVKTTFQ